MGLTLTAMEILIVINLYLVIVLLVLGVKIDTSNMNYMVV